MIEVETTEEIEHKDHQPESSIVKTASSEQSEISGKIVTVTFECKTWHVFS